MIDDAVRERSGALVQTLLDSIRIASVSLTGEGIGDQVAFLRKRLEGWGFAVEVHDTTSHPIIYAEAGPADAKFTWLLYGHYDVYPADEKQEGWRTKPFEPVIEGDRIWGRGAGDNKGQHLAMLGAIATWRETRGELPVRIKLILEGDEETGSVPLPKFVEANRARLKADLCVYSDGPMFPNDQPVLLMGVRGNLGLEFISKGAKRNLHSGNFGGVAPNPTLDLIHFLAEIVDRDGKLTVPGAGYADVKVAPADLEAVRTLPVDHEGFRESVGADPTTGSDDALFHERLMLRPAFNVSGFAAGYSGAGSKSIIFKEAIAKADVRLVAGQDPVAVADAIRAHAAKLGYKGIEIKSLKGTPASRTPLDHAFVPMVRDAVAKGFGRDPFVVPSLGGTTPDFVFTKLLGLPSIVIPLAPYDENNHAPNESTKVSLYLAGVRSGLHLLEAMARA
ncbi:M20/M25/M40 family metallo-hydrolase [Usitatibacter palustris]|uniref:Succinyl-diaminopimelate desuccinylase n=1 Tax=Usitatibacter palustris TaxID=2732487 RepID=A0A6M4H8W3_9PROT|nr:M20/M25/M40 family metallo-hydrolase [Usitatibacter palustris]QJR16046.1 Succinyl-diaminopimelate desuccinylase [Usitatibacter palustris]